MATSARPKLRMMQFPCNITNSLALGMAGCWWGGRTLKDMPQHSLGSSHFPRTSDEARDAFVEKRDADFDKS